MSTLTTTTSDVDLNYADLYSKAAEKLREITSLQGVVGLLQWDEMTMMPSGAAASRGAQKSSMAGVIYDKQTDAELGALLKTLKTAAAAAQLDEVQQAVVRDEYKNFIKNTALPKELVQRIAQLETDAYLAWVEARKEADFSKFAPFLQQWLDVSLEKARCIDPHRAAYDVLLDDYEKGMTSARLDAIFTEVRAGLVPLIAEIQNSAATAPDSSLLTNGDFDVDVQAKFCKEIALDLGFDESHGRLDVSVHPFTGGAHPTDVRMTTRFKRGDITEGLTGAVHETGHALYEQGRNLQPQWRDLSVSNALSMGVHESQSLLWERMVALSKPFQQYLLPKLQLHFPQQFGAAAVADFTAAKLYAAMNKVKQQSVIRVEADEVTYTMHVILRYEIEKALIDGSLTVQQVPAVWKQKMQQYLGVAIEDDAAGCLQDVHWAGGAFAYFPTYSLGAMYACQLYQHAQSQVPDLEDAIAKGDFKSLKMWLNEHVHSIGSLPASGDELMQRVTGKQLDPQIYLRHLREKYTEIYQLSDLI